MLAVMVVSSPGCRKVLPAEAVVQLQETRTLAIWMALPVLFRSEKEC